MNIRKGDKIKVLSGKDRGKTGKVTRALPTEGKIVVEKVNVVKKHKKSMNPNQSNFLLRNAAETLATRKMG